MLLQSTSKTKTKAAGAALALDLCGPKDMETQFEEALTRITSSGDTFVEWLKKKHYKRRETDRRGGKRG